MSDIEVGEFVRSNKGIVARVIGKDDDNNIMLDLQQIITKIEEKKTKHSKNIIDLIEVEDYVNEKLVSNVDKVDNKNFIEWEDGDMYSTEIPNDKFIKSIVTKEQFASVEYKLEG